MAYFDSCRHLLYMLILAIVYSASRSASC